MPKKKITLNNTTDVMPVGKHKGKSIQWILEHDMQYLQWVIDYSQSVTVTGNIIVEKSAYEWHAQ